MKFQRRFKLSQILLSLSLINFNTSYGIILSSYDDNLFAVISYKQ